MLAFWSDDAGFIEANEFIGSGLRTPEFWLGPSEICSSDDFGVKCYALRITNKYECTNYEKFQSETGSKLDLH